MQNKKQIKYSSKQPRLKRRRKAWILLVIVLVVALVGWKIHADHNATKAATTPLSQGEKIEQTTGQKQADQKGVDGPVGVSSATGTPPKDSTGTASSGTTQASSTVTPVITYPVSTNDGGKGESVTSVEVDAYIPSIEESGGTCTLTLTGPESITKTDTSSLSGQTTRCQNFYLTSAEGISTGTWTATVSYASATYKGVSQPDSFTIY